MSDDTCQICAVNKVNVEIWLWWGISPCASWMIEWIKQEATVDFVPKDSQKI